MTTSSADHGLNAECASSETISAGQPYLSSLQQILQLCHKPAHLPCLLNLAYPYIPAYEQSYCTVSEHLVIKNPMDPNMFIQCVC